MRPGVLLNLVCPIQFEQNADNNTCPFFVDGDGDDEDDDQQFWILI